MYMSLHVPLERWQVQYSILGKKDEQLDLLVVIKDFLKLLSAWLYLIIIDGSDNSGVGMARSMWSGAYPFFLLILITFNGISRELMAFNVISIQWDVMVINGSHGFLRERPSLQTVCEVEKHHCSLANHLHFGVICHSKVLDYDAVPPERMEFYGKVRRMPKAKPFRAPALW